jgi:hypothetical protein
MGSKASLKKNIRPLNYLGRPLVIEFDRIVCNWHSLGIHISLGSKSESGLHRNRALECQQMCFSRRLDRST